MPNSWIRGCYIHMREGDTGPLFYFREDDGMAYVRLDSYAIIPIEKYRRLEELAEMWAEAEAKDLIARILSDKR